MTLPTSPFAAGTSTRPYLIRALHDWCCDNGYTPYIAVFVDASVRVPPEYVKNNEIVLNVGFEATTALQLGNEAIEFKARFGGSPREIVVPVTHVVAIYARENGQGMAFPAPTDPATDSVQGHPAGGGEEGAATPHLTLAGTPSRPAVSRASRKPGPKPAAPAVPADTPQDNDPPEPTPPARPALKRIK